ncbi:uncharacterized protein LOC110686930 [Chenopodium quinoa]|uniref:uncharacterized protein LOC110686930 n=1 Tax=Chenopodium quinoa TaxID=63459 RepID=UPI000B784191|nr:uncharacterized protein LOC110686930 [Chenopodium quinoa]
MIPIRLRREKSPECNPSFFCWRMSLFCFRWSYSCLFVVEFSTSVGQLFECDGQLKLAKEKSASRSTTCSIHQGTKAPLRTNVHIKALLQLPSSHIKRRRGHFSSGRPGPSAANMSRLSTPLVNWKPL